MKILMVCLGNICRSPLAHGIMEHLVKEQGLLDWQVDSAGTGNWHIGQGPDLRSTRQAIKHGLDISGQVCRQFSVSDFDAFDLIVVMDRNNKADVLRLARSEADRNKVKMLLGDLEVPDPYHDDTQFAPVYNMIAQGCADMLKTLAR